MKDFISQIVDLIYCDEQLKMSIEFQGQICWVKRESRIFKK